MDSSTDRRKSLKVFMPQDSRRRAGITTFLRRNSRFLGGRSLDDLESQLGGFPLELLDLCLPVLSLVECRSLIDIFDPVAQHAVDQSGQLRGHGLDRDRSPQPGPQSTKLRSYVGVALPQGAGGHL